MKNIHPPFFLVGVAMHLGQPSKWQPCSGTGFSSLCFRLTQMGMESTQQLEHTTQDPWTGNLWILWMLHPRKCYIPVQSREVIFLCIKKYSDAYSLIIAKGWHLNSLWVPAITLHLSNSFPIETDSCSGCLTLLSTFPLIPRGLKSLESYSQAHFVIHWNFPFASS